MVWSKTSRHERGYGTAWNKLRLVILKRDCGLCQVCAINGITTLAKAVDHIKDKASGGTDDPDNLQSICEPCHADKTLKDKGHKSRPAIGPDGWPVTG